jgi:hypothetical protein
VKEIIGQTALEATATIYNITGAIEKMKTLRGYTTTAANLGSSELDSGGSEL